MSSTSPKAVAYIRVSNGVMPGNASDKAQAAKIAAWCKLNGCELVQTFTDLGVSGKRADNRPNLKKALDLACSLRGILIVYSLSRLARSTQDTILIAERMERAGADLVSVTEKIDTTTAAGRMMFRLLAMLAEFERELIAERTSDALQQKKANNERVGAVPYGFGLAEDGRKLFPIQAEQHVITLIRELREQHLTYRAICQTLNERGIPTKSGGGMWRPKLVMELCKRETASLN